MNEIELTQELVEINSQNPTHSEKEIALYIKDFLEDLKMYAEVEEFQKNRSSVVASLGKGEGLLLNGHIDTVPEVAGWTKDPFKGKIEANKIFGLGSSDMKGGVAAILSAVSKLAKEKFKRKLLLTFVADEEVGQMGSEHLIEKRKDLFKDVEYGIVAEPTDLKIEIAQKGVVDFKVWFSGKSAHGSRPEEGDNAIYKATAFIEEVKILIKELEKTKHKLLGSGTINIGKIEGGVKINIVPDSCVIEVDRRLIPGETPELAKTQLENILKKLHLDGKIEQVVGRHPLLVSEKSLIVEEIQKIRKSEITFAAGYTEAELYKTKAGVECIVFGPGNHKIHCPDEYIEIDKLKEATQIYEKLIRNWCL